MVDKITVIAGLIGLASGAVGGYFGGVKRTTDKIEAEYARKADEEINEIRTKYRKAEQERKEVHEKTQTALREAREQFNILCEEIKKKFDVDMPWEEVPADKIDYSKIAPAYPKESGSTKVETKEEPKPKKEKKKPVTYIPNRENVSPHLNDESLAKLREMKEELESEGYVLKEDGDSELTVENENQPEPYLINEETFFLNEKDYEQITVTYFINDGIVTDDSDHIISNSTNLFGNALNRIPADEGDVYYIRNNSMETEIEVVLEKESFGDVIGRL